MANKKTLTEIPLRVPTIRSFKNIKKISALTAYDYTMASIIDRAGVDIILVGDSLGCVIQGHETTLPVSLDEMIYHCRCVSKASKRALVVGDMPFLSYQVSPSAAIESAGRLIKEGGVAAVKLEGGRHVAHIIEQLVGFDIPVMGHVGLTPQSFHRMGGHKIQGRTSSAEKIAGSREQVIEDAQMVEQSGAFAIVLEGIPPELAAEITSKLEIPTIGIAAGQHCDGQILVSNDLLGLTASVVPKFVKPYDNLTERITNAVGQFCEDIQGSIQKKEAS